MRDAVDPSRVQVFKCNDHWEFGEVCPDCGGRDERDVFGICPYHSIIKSCNTCKGNGYLMRYVVKVQSIMGDEWVEACPFCRTPADYLRRPPFNHAVCYACDENGLPINLSWHQNTRTEARLDFDDERIFFEYRDRRGAWIEDIKPENVEMHPKHGQIEVGINCLACWGGRKRRDNPNAQMALRMGRFLCASCRDVGRNWRPVRALPSLLMNDVFIEVCGRCGNDVEDGGNGRVWCEECCNYTNWTWRPYAPR